MALAVVMKKLKKAATVEDRLSIYRILKADKKFSTFISNDKNITSLAAFVLKDISDENGLLQLEALYLLKIILSHEQITESLNNDILKDIITGLTVQAKATESSHVYADIIDCLSQLVCYISPNIISDELPQLFLSLERCFSEQFTEHAILCKVCHLFQKLIRQSADKMIPHLPLWVAWVLKPLCHENSEVRQVAIKNLELSTPIFLMTEKVVLPILVVDVKSNLVKEMIMLYEVDKTYVLKLWGDLITILGRVLHRGSSFINILLEIVEKAFKSDNEYIHIQALVAWEHLINNFATDLEVIGNQKRLKLLLQPLKLNKIQSEKIALTKCKLWWNLIWQLDSKLISYFEMVCIPLLQFSLSSRLKDSNPVVTPPSPATTRSGKRPDVIPLGPKTESLQKFGCEILARLLEHQKKGSPGGIHSSKKIPNISIMPLKTFIPNNVYIQHIKVIMCTVKVVLGHISNYNYLIEYILQTLTSRTASLIEDKNNSPTEAVSAYFQLISFIVEKEICSSNHCIKLLDTISLFPKELLTMQVTNIEHRNQSYNIPLKAILSIMLEPKFLTSVESHDKYLCVLSSYLSTVQNVMVPLRIMQAVIEKLGRTSDTFPDKIEILYKTWSHICVHLLEIIQKTQEVNQGDNSSPDFSCIVMVLCYPISHLVSANFITMYEKQLWKNWSDLYKAFVRCAALIPYVEANTPCELITSKVQEIISDDQMKMPLTLSAMCHVLQIVVDCIDYNALEKDFSDISLPNWHRRKEQPLHNITSCTCLLERLLKTAAKLIETNSDGIEEKQNNQLLTFVNNLLDVMKKLTAEINTSSLLKELVFKLSPLLVPFYSLNKKKLPFSKFFNVQFLQTLESLWTSLLTSLQLHYSGPYDSEFLEAVSSLLEINILNPNKNIVDRTRQFWYTTFGCNIANLTLPASFKSVAKKVRPSLIPDTEISPVEEISVSASPSQDISDESVSVAKKKSDTSFSVPSVQNRGFLSKKLNSNFQHTLTSKNKEKPISAPLSFSCMEEIGDEHFVRIEAPKKINNVLTEHQKEIRKRRSYVPAMYNDLSQETINIDSQSLSQNSSDHEIINEVTSKANKSLKNKCILYQDKNEKSTNKTDITVNTTGNTKQIPTITLNSLESIETVPLFSSSIEEEEDTLNNNSETTVNTNNDHCISKEFSKKSDSVEKFKCHGEEISVIENDPKLSSSPVIILKDFSVELGNEISSQNGNYYKINNFDSLNITTIEESAIVTENHEIDGYNNNTNSERFLVVNDDNNTENNTPRKQGVLRLVRNKRRLSTLFPKIVQDHSEASLSIEVDDDAIPSSQDSVRRSLSFNKNPQNRNKNDSKHKAKTATCTPNSSVKDNYKENDEIENNMDDALQNDKFIHEYSQQLLKEIETASALSKSSSSESVKIIDDDANLNKSKSAFYVDLVTSSSKSDSSGETSNLNHTSQKESDYESLTDKSPQFQYAQDITVNINHTSIPENKSLCSSSDDDNSNKSPKLEKHRLESVELTRRRSQRKIMPTRRVKEMLSSLEYSHSNPDTVNYKELLECRKKLSPSSNSLPAMERGNYCDNTERNNSSPVSSKNKSLDEKLSSSSALHSPVTRVLFPKTKLADNQDVTEPPITSTTENTSLAEKYSVSDPIIDQVKLVVSEKETLSGKSRIYCNNQNEKHSLINNHDVNYDDDKISEPVKDFENIVSDNNFVQNNYSEIVINSQNGITDPLLKSHETSPQEEQEQTPELKKTDTIIVSISKRSTRSKTDKAGKLKSIELEKLFSESNEQTNAKQKEGTNADSSNVPICMNGHEEKPRGARKRKMKTVNQTSAIVTRLRVRSAIAKQRALQKPRSRGRPKSRNSGLGITHRHKPKRLSNVMLKSSPKSSLKEETLLIEGDEEKENNACKELGSSSVGKTEEVIKETEKIDEDVLNQVKELPTEKEMLTENEQMCKDEKTIKNFSDSPQKRTATDIRHYRKSKKIFNLPISPLSRSQKILRAAIGNIASHERGMPWWKSNKTIGSPNKSKSNEISPDLSPSESTRCLSRRVKHVYSPLASPSTGILKKRLMNEQSSDSSSPPLKQRKVSFADPLVEYEVSVDSSGKEKLRSVSRCLEMSKNCNTITSSQTTNGAVSNTQSPSDASIESSEEYQATPFSPYDNQEKVFPLLIGCQDPIDVILPYLTCSLWPRGLGQLVHARNICTIGSLASLTVSEILLLPVKSPKVETVQKALQDYLGRHQQEKSITNVESQKMIEYPKQQSKLLEVKNELSDSQDLSASNHKQLNSINHIEELQERKIEEYNTVESINSEVVPLPESKSDNSSLDDGAKSTEAEKNQDRQLCSESKTNDDNAETDIEKTVLHDQFLSNGSQLVDCIISNDNILSEKENSSDSWLDFKDKDVHDDKSDSEKILAVEVNETQYSTKQQDLLEQVVEEMLCDFEEESRQVVINLVNDVVLKENTEVDASLYHHDTNVDIPEMDSDSHVDVEVERVNSDCQINIEIENTDSVKEVNIEIENVDNTEMEKIDSNMQVNSEVEKVNSDSQINVEIEKMDSNIQVDNNSQICIEIEKVDSNIQVNNDSQINVEIEKMGSTIQVNDEEAKVDNDSQINVEIEKMDSTIQVNDEEAKVDNDSQINAEIEKMDSTIQVNDEEAKLDNDSQINVEIEKMDSTIQINDEEAKVDNDSQINVEIEKTDSTIQVNDEEAKVDNDSQINVEIEKTDSTIQVNDGEAKVDNDSQINVEIEKMDSTIQVNDGEAKVDNDSQINAEIEKMDSTIQVNDEEAKLDNDSQINVEIEKMDSTIQINDEEAKVDNDSQINVEIEKVDSNNIQVNNEVEKVDDSQISIDIEKIDDNRHINIEIEKIDGDSELNFEVEKMDIDSQVNTQVEKMVNDSHFNVKVENFELNILYKENTSNEQNEITKRVDSYDCEKGIIKVESSYSEENMLNTLNENVFSSEEEPMVGIEETDSNSSMEIPKQVFSIPSIASNIESSSEIEKLQSIFTIENLKKCTLLNLVEMLQKLTTAIHFKTKANDHC